jgi:adenine-specific DNA glycosylase
VGITKADAEDTPYEPPKIPKQPSPPQPNIEPPKQQSKPTVTDKGKNVTRVANRLGWIDTQDPEEAIKHLTKEADKMNENVYKYLESLARLGKDFCHEDNPSCIKCPMNQGCKYRMKLKTTDKKGFFKR